MNPFSIFINNFRKNNNDEEIINESLAQDAITKKNSLTKVGFKRIVHKGLEYNASVISDRGIDFKPPEYDLNQIAAIIDIDSYLRRAIEKYVELILKNGFEFVGRNNSTVKYIRKRFEQIALVTSIPTTQLFEDICQQLVAYSNCFISKVRNENSSGGKPYVTFYGKELKPVAGYFVEDATSIYIAKDENGKIFGYKQIIKGASYSPEWRTEDMIHIYYSRKRGLSFGTPLSYPVIDDIKALRKIEQNIEILSHQHTIPIIQYTIGSKERPGAIEEVIQMKSELENSPPYGCIVTTERHKVEAINVNLNAEGTDKLAEIFKMRVYAGLGVSPMTMGDGAGTGRQTAESLDKQMENTAEKYMKVIKTFINEFMIKELLLEGGYSYDAYDDKNKVELYFPPINIEAKNKVEEHLNNMYQGNLLTETEVRVEMGRDPMTPDQHMDTNLQHVQIPIALIKAVDELYTGPGAGKPNPKSSGSTTSTNKPSGSPLTAIKKIQNKIANSAQPVNQHGKSLSRPRIAKDSIFKEKIMIHYNATIDDIIMALDDDNFAKSIKSIMNTSINMIKENLEDHSKINYIEGYNLIENHELINFSNDFRDSINQDKLFIENYFNDIIKKFNKLIEPNSDKIKKVSMIRSIFDNQKDEFINLIDNLSLKSYDLGRFNSLDNIIKE